MDRINNSPSVQPKSIFWSKQLDALSHVHSSVYLNSLRPLLDAIGWNHKSRYIFEALPYDLSNFNCYGFLRVMDLLNFESSSFTTSLKNLDERFYPCLFIRQDNKVFILLSADTNYLTLYDGQEKSEKKLKLSELDSTIWQGRVYLFKQKIESEPEVKPNENWFTTVISKFKTLSWLILIIDFLLNLLALAVPIFIMVVYDRVIIANSLSTLISISIGVIIAIAATAIFQRMHNQILAYLGARLDITASNSIMQKIYSLPLSHLENAPLNLQLAKIKGFDSIRDFFTGQTIELISNFLFSLVFIFTIWVLAGALVWIPLVTIFIAYICSFALWGYFKKLIKEANQLNIEEQNLWLEILVNIRAIKYIHSEDVWLDRFKKKSAELAFATYRLNVINNIIVAFFDTLTTISAVAILGFGVISILDNALTIGALLATMILLWRILNPIKSIYTIMSKLDQTRLNISQVNALMNIETENSNKKINDQIVISGHINVFNVSFRYSPKSDPVLLNVSFKAEPNTVIGIAGPNGSGKSTLLKLIIGLYQSQMGYIQLDGYDIRQLDMHELRYQIAFIPKEIAFFNGTIEQNLLLAKPDATFQEMQDALKLAYVYEDIIKLPNGLQSTLKKHDRPILPSKVLQKLVFSRAFLKNSQLILIDKTLDRLAPSSMMQMLQTIHQLKNSRTIIIITSDYEVLDKVDRIIFLDKGRMIMDGPKDTVLNDKRLQPYFMV